MTGQDRPKWRAIALEEQAAQRPIVLKDPKNWIDHDDSYDRFDENADDPANGT